VSDSGGALGRGSGPPWAVELDLLMEIASAPVMAPLWERVTEARWAQP
jgi:hypothetical protein